MPTSVESDMLTGALLRVRYSKDEVIPRYVTTDDSALLTEAEALLDLFHGHIGDTRSGLETDIEDSFADEPGQFLRRGLIKLLEDRSEWSVVSERPPEEIRATVFSEAVRRRAAGTFDRSHVLESVASDLQMSGQQVDDALFADLKSEQRLMSIAPLSAERLLERYNVALAQAVLLKAVRVTIEIRGEPPAHMRRLVRLIKFHRLICEVSGQGGDTWKLQLDGPLSLFSATQKYGLQLALFVPAILNCRDFQLVAELRWGPEKKPKEFRLSPRTGLVSHLVETGTYVPPEVTMFAEQFRKKHSDWDLREEAVLQQLGNGYWVPDFRLVHRPSGQSVLFEILGYWRKTGAEGLIKRLQECGKFPFLIALSDSLRVDDDEIGNLANVVRFKNVPLCEKVVRAAAQLIDV